jgi:hypothetical protein
VNTGAILPLGTPEELEATSLYVSQRWGGTSLLLGKINAIDLLANDPFFGGWGIDRFMNLVFVALPSGVVPPVIMGGVLAQKIGEVSLSAMVFDPADQTTNYGVDGLFEDGVNGSLSAQWNGRTCGRASNLSRPQFPGGMAALLHWRVGFLSRALAEPSLSLRSAPDRRQGTDDEVPHLDQQNQDEKPEYPLRRVGPEREPRSQ